MGENNNDVGVFEWILKDLVVDMYGLKLHIDKSKSVVKDMWKVEITDPKSKRSETYKVKKVSELTTYDKASSMALNIVDDVMRRLFHNSVGCAMDGSVRERFKISTGH